MQTPGSRGVDYESMCLMYIFAERHTKSIVYLLFFLTIKNLRLILIFDELISLESYSLLIVYLPYFISLVVFVVKAVYGKMSYHTKPLARVRYR